MGGAPHPPFPCRGRALRAKFPSFLCLSQESSRRASGRRKESFQPKDLGWLDPCDKHRAEGGGGPLSPAPNRVKGHRARPDNR
ncbi:hypothetical protein YA62_000955 [Agrobacterium sp. LC34]|nr:hypothetical protein CFBP6623_01660 [Agrobacterium tumefaciens]TKT67414.1 hypothetical protein YA62_000955 [Agrobacterium sp. LC34]